MKKLILTSIFVFGFVLVAQPPAGGGRGHGGFGPGFGPESRMMMAGPASRTPVTGAPYSAVQTRQFQQALSGGNQISRQEQVKVYRDSSGRVRTEATFTRPGSTTAQTMISVFDPVGGYSYMLNPAKASAVRTALPQANQAHTERAPGNRSRTAQVQTENLGTQTVNGVAATGTRTTEMIAAGAIGNAQPIQVVREVWVSVDLKVPVMIKSSDPRFGNTVMQLTNIVQSEPDAALFQVPANYTVTTRGEGFGSGRGHRQQ